MTSSGEASPSLQYRCVCGAMNACHEGESRLCSECGRAFTVDPLHMSMTVTVDSTGRLPPLRNAGGAAELVGARLDHFLIQEPLGSGGMGAVYRALDESLERYVAIKVIRSDDRDPEQVQRLMQEAIAQARVNHPHIAHIYFVKRDPQTPYLAMELATGGTLGDRLKQRGPLRFVEVANLAEQLADALRHAAEFDIVHGDIKPNNILISADGRAKLSDFGLARRRSQLADREGGAVSGTPYYLAPEAAEGAPLDERTDMYALGVTLFELTFGRLPYTFAGNTLSDAMRVHQQAEIEFPTFSAEIPERWSQILKRLLAKNPGDRYQSYDDLLHDLRQVRPAVRADAGVILRLQAWVLDVVLVAVLGLAFPAAVAGILAAQGSMFWSGFLFNLLSLLAVSAAQVGFGQLKTSPGKWLLQLRIVDDHGLAPSLRILIYRGFFQLLPIWSVVLNQILVNLRIPGLGLGFVVPPLAMLFVSIDGAFMFSGPFRRSLHDRLFGTRVVLASERD